MKIAKCMPVLASVTMLSIGMAFQADAADAPPKDAMASLLTAAPSFSPVSNYQGEDWRSSLCAFCSGDLGAERQALYEKGLVIDLGMTNVVQGVTGGGTDKDTAYTNIMDQQISLDTGRSDLWPGGLMVLHGRSKIGSDVLADARTISPVNHTALTPDGTKNDQWFLEEYYLVQALSETWSVIGGRVLFAGIGDLNRFAGDEKTQFLNTSLRNSPLLGIVSQAQSLHGAALNYTPNPDIIISPFLLSNNDEDAKWGSPGGLFSEYSAGIQGQFSWKFNGLKGYISPIFGYTSANAADLDNSLLIRDAVLDLPVPVKDDNWVAGFSFDHYLYQPAASKTAASGSAKFDKEPEGIGVFARFHYSPEDRNPWNTFASIGLGGRGMIPGRANDRFGLGFYTLFESGDIDDQPIIGDALENEEGLELFYNAALTPWLQVTPSVQYIDSGVKSIDDTTVLSMRVQIDF